MGNCCDKSEPGLSSSEAEGHDNPVVSEPKSSHELSRKEELTGKDKDNYFLIQVCHGHDAAINCMVLSPDDSILATGSDDGTVRIWTTKTVEVECVGCCAGHDNYITCIAFQDEYLFTGSADNTARRWDLATCECITTYRGHAALVYKVICIGEHLLSSSYDKTVRMWDVEKGIEIRRFSGHQRGVYPMIYINLQDLDISSPVKPSNVLMQGERERHVLITGSADSTAKFWSVDSGRCLRTFIGHENSITCMTCDNTGSVLFTGSLDGMIRSWRMATSEALLIFEGHQGAIIHLQVVAKILYSSSADRTVRAWVSETAINTRVYKGHKKSITNFKVHKGFLYTVSGDSISQIYSAKTAVLQRTLDGHKAPITCLTVVDDRLFTASLDKTVRVWDASYLEEGFTLENQNKIDPKKMRERRLKAMAKMRAQQIAAENDRPQEGDIFVPADAPRDAMGIPIEEPKKEQQLAKVNLAKRIKKNTIDGQTEDDGYDYGQRQRKSGQPEADKPKATEKKAFPGSFSESAEFRPRANNAERPPQYEKKQFTFGSSSANTEDDAYRVRVSDSPVKKAAPPPTQQPIDETEEYNFEE